MTEAQLDACLLDEKAQTALENSLGRSPEDDIALLESLGMPVAGGGPGEGRFIVAADGNKSLPAKPPRKLIPVDSAP